MTLSKKLKGIYSLPGAACRRIEMSEGYKWFHREGYVLIGFMCFLALGLAAGATHLDKRVKRNLTAKVLQKVDHNKNGRFDPDEVAEIYRTLNIHYSKEPKSTHLRDYLKITEND